MTQSWADVPGLHSQVPGFEDYALYIKSTVDPVKNGPGGLSGGVQYYGDEPECLTFAAGMAEVGNTIGGAVELWSRAVAGGGIRVKAIAGNYEGTEENNTRLATLPELQDPRGGSGFRPGGPAQAVPPVHRPVTPGTPSVPVELPGEPLAEQLVPQEENPLLPRTPVVPPGNGPSIPPATET